MLDVSMMKKNILILLLIIFTCGAALLYYAYERRTASSLVSENGNELSLEYVLPAKIKNIKFLYNQKLVNEIEVSTSGTEEIFFRVVRMNNSLDFYFETEEFGIQEYSLEIPPESEVQNETTGRNGRYLPSLERSLYEFGFMPRDGEPQSRNQLIVRAE